MRSIWQLPDHFRIDSQCRFTCFAISLMDRSLSASLSEVYYIHLFFSSGSDRMGSKEVQVQYTLQYSLNKMRLIKRIKSFVFWRFPIHENTIMGQSPMLRF